jgi:hypothetical protein
MMNASDRLDKPAEVLCRCQATNPQNQNFSFSDAKALAPRPPVEFPILNWLHAIWNVDHALAVPGTAVHSGSRLL